MEKHLIIWKSVTIKWREHLTYMIMCVIYMYICTYNKHTHVRDWSISLHLILGEGSSAGQRWLGIPRSGHSGRRLLGLKPYTLGVEISMNRWIPFWSDKVLHSWSLYLSQTKSVSFPSTFFFSFRSLTTNCNHMFTCLFS